jgi:hypothetical protein
MQNFLGGRIETSSEYDEPATVAGMLMLALPEIGFKQSSSVSKLVPGRCADPRCPPSAEPEEAAFYSEPPQDRQRPWRRAADGDGGGGR